MKSKVKVSFWRIFWPSLTASILLLVLLIIFFFILLGGIFSGPKPYSVKKDSVLHITLSGEIGEISDTKFEPGIMGISSKIGLADILYGLENAANDEKIKGLFLEIGNPQCGYATAKEIRDAINKFEASGKFAIAYFQGEAISLKQYYIASAADETYGFPSSMFEFGGLGVERMYYKGLFDKLDLEMQVIRGKNNDFKSAVEPYFLHEMSDSSRLQTERYLASMWEDICDGITDETGVGSNTLNNYADNTSIRRVAHAVQFKLINSSKYRDEVMDIIADKSGKEKAKDVNLISFKTYAQKKFEANQKIARGKKANVAVIIAEGVIIKNGDGDGISSDKITKLLQKVRLNDEIKTVVLRINSPGGSALASDEIWREVKLTCEAKPVIVSMGDVAASGGYYIATTASRIFAETNTITGSIGVFGVIPYTGKMLENKLGLTFDRIGTNNRSVLSTNKRLTNEEFEIIQEEVDFIYETFLDRVVKGRAMTNEQVNEIARGRVWTGKDAIEIGLIDELGGLQSAIKYAISTVEIDDDAIIEYFPRVKKEPWMEILEALDDKNDDKDDVKSSKLPSALISYYEKLKSIESMTGIQARLPYELNFK